MTFKNKKIVSKNGITIFLTKNKLSFEKLSKQIQQIEIKKFNADPLYVEKNITPYKVYTWAQGSIPKTTEIQALAYLKYGNTNKWLEFYIPSRKIILYMLKDAANELLSKSFDNFDDLKKQISSLTYIDALRIVEDSKAIQFEKATAFTYIAWRHYLSVLTKTYNVDKLPLFSIESKNDILSSIYKIIDYTIDPYSSFSTNIAEELKGSITLVDFENVLVKNKTKKILLPYLFKLFE